MILTQPESPAKASHPAEQRPHRVHSPGVDLTVFHRAHLSELHITLRPARDESCSLLLWRLGRLLKEHDATVVKQDVFGTLSAFEATMAQMKYQFRELDWPVMWVEGAGDPNHRYPIAGMQVMAVSGTEVDTLRLDGQAVGRIFQDGSNRHCVLGNLAAKSLASPKTVQASQVYQRMERALAQGDMGLSDVARTWFFLDDILSWYGPFNKVRRGLFTRRNLFDTGVPASTGIGVRNPAGAAMVAGAWAVRALGGLPAPVEAVPSPLQCPASRYGSCFSRAVEWSAPDVRRLMISGTAGIAPDGRSACGRDVAGQIDLTMQVIEAILKSRGYALKDVTRAAAYFKNIADAPRLKEWSRKNGVRLPAVEAQCTLCRDELLFELELDALAPARHQAKKASPDSLSETSNSGE